MRIFLRHEGSVKNMTTQDIQQKMYPGFRIQCHCGSSKVIIENNLGYDSERHDVWGCMDFRCLACGKVTEFANPYGQFVKGEFSAPVGYIMPWADEENIPEGWKIVDGLYGEPVVKNPGSPTSTIMLGGVWIRKIT